MRQNKKNILIIIGIIINLFIWTNSVLPGKESGALSGGITHMVYDFLASMNINVEINDLSLFIRKFAHFSEFLLLGLVWIVIIKEFKHKYFIAIFYGMMVAVIDEFIQYFIPGRVSSVFDVLIDVLGVLTGILIVYLANLIVKTKIKNVS